MIKPDYAKVNSLFLTYPENFDHEYHELAPFFEGLISLCPDDVTCFVIVNNENSARYLRRIFKNKDVRPIVVSDFYEVWLRDIMGFACDGFVLKPKFKPDYCTDIYTDGHLKEIETQTKYIIKKSINVPIKEIDLIWDGGNLGTNGTHAFVFDKIVKDNPNVDLTCFFKEKLNTELILLEGNKYDCLNHTDGYFSFISKNEVLLSQLPERKELIYDRNHIQKIKQILQSFEHKIHRILEAPNFQYRNGIASANGIHINHININNHCITPEFNGLNSFSDSMKNKNIETLLKFNKNISSIHCNDISKHGGGLRCLSWQF